MLRSWSGMAATGILMVLLGVLSIALVSPLELPSAIGRVLGFSTAAALISS